MGSEPRRRRAPLRARSVEGEPTEIVLAGTLAGPLLAVEGVDASYGPVQVLYGASIVVQPGERVALLGTNGAGKSTLLRVISGLLPATAGRVSFRGRDVTNLEPHDLAAQGVIHVSGGRATFPSLTVAENLRLAAYRMRKDKAVVASRVNEAMDLFPRLRERAEQPCGTLSGGEQQMVAVGRALVGDPELLIIDELSLGLAPVVLKEIQGMLGELSRRGITMLIVEQSLDLAAQIASRCYFMEKGAIRFEGDINELKERGDLARAVFFGGVGDAVKETEPARARAKR
jgi:ABC-type branched-subunit amino acid transport system ATPase component